MTTSRSENDLRFAVRLARGEKIWRLIGAGRIRTSTVLWEKQTYVKSVCLPWPLYAAVFAFSQVQDGQHRAECWLNVDQTAGHLWSKLDGNIFAVINYKGHRALYKDHPWKKTTF